MKKLIYATIFLIVGYLGILFAIPNSPEEPQPSPSPIGARPTYFAEIDENGVVLRVIVISQENLNTGRWGDPGNWVETTIDGSKRKNYAGKGYKYDKNRDAFIPPKPNKDAILDEEKAQWITNENEE